MTLPVVFTANGTSGYNLTNSLRFRSSASAYLNRTPASAGNRQTWTWSGWVKRGILGTYQQIFGAYIGSGTTDTNYFEISFLTDLISITGYSTVYRRSTAVYRDPSAWYHIIVAVDTTQATAGNRLKVYVNGSEVTAFGTSNNPTQNTNLGINGAYPHGVGAIPANASYFDGYQTEVNFIDGQALTPSSFGETSTTTGVWIPKKYSGTYGTNGFYLPFTDNSALTTSSNVGLGKDFSGNANYWTTNNISITAGTTYDSMTDVPTLTSATAANYCVLNPLTPVKASILNANLTVNAGNLYSISTIGMTSGKWYAEMTVTTAGTESSCGIATQPDVVGAYVGNNTNSWGYYNSNGEKYNNSIGVTYGATYTTGDVIGIAFDADAGTLIFYKNNTSQGTAFTGLTSGPYYFAISGRTSGTPNNCSINFGQQPFVYTPPTGFNRLNTFNLPTPTIGATAPTLASKNMNIALYTGTGSSQSITGLGFQPDWTWIKERNASADHGLYDAVRGVQKQLESNNTDAETTETTGLTAFGSDGFTVGALAQLNTSADTYVAWNWKANGAGVTNTAGTITSTVSANASAGFSILTYTGNNTSGATVGHGLGVKPSFIVVKKRTGTDGWGIYHTSLGATKTMELNLTAGETTSAIPWNNTEPTSSVIYLNGNNYANSSSFTYVMYCFAPIAGYSAFGSYTANGSTDGPFVYAGFRPRFVMTKKSSSTGAWAIVDTSINPNNQATTYLQPNTSGAVVGGTSSNGMDMLSNGFKIRSSDASFNETNGDTYIYMAFAENPFKYANAR
jgi:hypothetical protein